MVCIQYRCRDTTLLTAPTRNGWHTKKKKNQEKLFVLPNTGIKISFIRIDSDFVVDQIVESHEFATFSRRTRSWWWSEKHVRPICPSNTESLFRKVFFSRKSRRSDIRHRHSRDVRDCSAMLPHTPANFVAKHDYTGMSLFSHTICVFERNG